MNRHFLLLILLVAITIAACAPPPNLRDETLLNDTSLITGEPCAAPCFRGVVPGETRWRDAVVSIQDDPEFSNFQEQQAEDSDAVQAAWQQGDNQICCQMASEDGEIVSLIFLRTAPTMNLGELTGAHGDPSYLIGSEFTEDQAIVSLVYPETPMVVYAFVGGAAEGELSETSEIIGVLYLVPSEMELLIQTQDLHEWEGYQSFAAYNDGPFEVTPSITLTPTPGE